MLFRSLTVPVAEFEASSGWQIKPEGACKGDVCIPLPPEALSDNGERINLPEVADTMQMPLVEEAAQQLYALGPESIGGRALVSAKAPDLELPDIDGNVFRLSSLIGKKVLIYAWAPY